MRASFYRAPQIGEIEVGRRVCVCVGRRVGRRVEVGRWVGVGVGVGKGRVEVTLRAGLWK